MDLTQIQHFFDAAEDDLESVCIRLAAHFGFQDWRWFATSKLPPVLGVAERTVYRWVEQGKCPEPHLRFLLLFEVVTRNESGGPEAPTS